jgi:hypothetical protein
MSYVMLTIAGSRVDSEYFDDWEGLRTAVICLDSERTDLDSVRIYKLNDDNRIRLRIRKLRLEEER